MHACIYTHACRQAGRQACTHTHTHTHTHTQTHTHTNTHTHRFLNYYPLEKYLKMYLEFLAGQSDSNDDPLGIIVNGAADKWAPKSGSLKSI